MIIEKFGKGHYKTFEETNEILFYIHNELIQHTKRYIQEENSLATYQYVQILHDQSNIVVADDNLVEIFPEFSTIEFAIYRRILKFIIEQACDIDLIFAEPLQRAKRRSLPFLKELIYLVYKLFNISNLIASQQLIEDSIEIYFNDEDLYILDYKHHYNEVIKEINKDYKEHLEESIVAENADIDFAKAMEKCLGLSFGHINREVESMHTHMANVRKEPFPCATGFDLHSLINNLSQNSKISYEEANKIISGLIISRETKCSFEDAIYKPQSINRHLYRPIIQWNVLRLNIRGEIALKHEIVLIGKTGLTMSWFLLSTNAINWRKYPVEWKNECFEEHVKYQYNKNDKVLEDKLEEILLEKEITYSRNITYLRRKNNQNIDIEHKNCGEIDFLILINNKIYIADSKYHLARYDFNNWKNDFAAFETNKKNYNKTISRKKEYLSTRKKFIQGHFELEYPDKSFKILDYEIECIFLINTPTFYMYNSTYKIFTIRDFKRFLDEEFVYPDFEINIENENGAEKLKVSHPYFKKPTYTIFKEENEV